MKKNVWFFVAAVCSVLILAAVIILASHTALQDKIMDILGMNREKQHVTTVSEWVYSDNDGNRIVYYVCITTHYEADIPDPAGLNIEAICAVITPAEAESCRECTVSGLPAVICHKDGRSFLCWTVIPELSCVIEYDPAVVSEEDIFRMAESIPANATTATNMKPLKNTTICWRPFKRYYKNLGADFVSALSLFLIPSPAL